MRRAQAALEFLTTYGWAFTVMLTMVAAISYFGVTNPVTFVPDDCRFPSDVICDDFFVTTVDVPSLAPNSRVGMVVVDLELALGRTAYLVDFTCKDSLDGQVFSYVQEGDDFTSTTNQFGSNNDIKQWNPGQRVTLKCFFSTNPFEGLTGELVRVPLEVTLQRRENGFNHVIDGELIGKIQ